MNHKELREIYNRILKGTASKDEKKKLFTEYIQLGGLSTEWFYSILKGTIEEPTKEEIANFNNLIKELESSF